MRRLHWLAIPFAAIATAFALIAPPGQQFVATALFALAFILSFVGLVEAVIRCANALEKRN